MTPIGARLRGRLEGAESSYGENIKCAFFISPISTTERRTRRRLTAWWPLRRLTRRPWRRDLAPPDLIIFSGDLTYAGTHLGAFAEAYDRTIKRIADAVGVTSDRVLLAPGNHDISRTIALSGSSIVEHGMRQVLTSRDALNEFVRG